MLRLGVGSGGSDRPLATVRVGVSRFASFCPKRDLYVAALGPKMCQLAGEIADGVLFNWATPARLRQANAWVDEGCRGAGRGTLVVRPGDDGDRTRDRLGAEAGRYARSPAYGRAFAAQGVPR